MLLLFFFFPPLSVIKIGSAGHLAIQINFIDQDSALREDNYVGFTCVYHTLDRLTIQKCSG